MKKILMMALAAATILSSCSKQDDAENLKGKDFSFVLKVDAAKLGSPTTRAEEPGLTHNVSTTSVKSMVIYYLNGSTGSTVIGSRTLTEAEITSATGSSGLVMSGINATATHVYVVANYAENGVAIATAGTTLANIKAATVTMGSNDTGDWSKALLSPEADGVVIDKSDGKIGTVDSPFTVAVTILPALSRLEIAKVSIITTEKTLPQLTAVSFKFGGIAVNGHFSAFTVGGATSGTAHVWDKTELNDYTNIPNWCSDRFSPINAGDASYSPTGGTNVWAYMLPAGTTPRIVLSIPEKTFAGPVVVITDPWLTVKKMKNSVGGAYIETFKRGYFYKIEDINFDAYQTRDTPNPEDDIFVEVKVTVAAWQGITVTPEF